MDRSQPVEITETALLLVEGRDDEEVLRRLCDHIDVGGIQILGYGGRYGLRDYLKTVRLLSGYERVERIGIVRDADDGADNAFRSVCGALANAGLPVPSQPRRLSDGVPRVSTMIVPPDRPTGCLETLLWLTIETAETAECIDKYMDCARIPASGNRRDKAKVYAYVAVQRQPGLKIGEAAKAGYWNLDHSALLSVKDFLKSLVT